MTGPLDLFAAKLKPNGEFRLATDDPTYLTWALMVMQRHRGQFELLAKSPKDFLEPSGGWIETRERRELDLIANPEVRDELDATWRLLYHQGTLVPVSPAASQDTGADPLAPGDGDG